jgi:RNA polymerase sigma factor (TIGR02999 family)
VVYGTEVGAARAKSGLFSYNVCYDRQFGYAGMDEVTSILSAIEQDDPRAADQLLPLLYGELRKLAAQKLASEKAGQTLQATALVHEAYVRLVGNSAPQHWNSRGHFFAAAAEAMRRILIDQARRKRTQRRGEDGQRIELSAVEPAVQTSEVDVLALDEALNRLAARDPRATELVKLRFFAGLSVAEAAQALGVYAKTWLKKQLMTGGD